MGKYKVLHPIAYSGRRERGQVVEIPDADAASYLKPGLVEPYEGNAEPVNEPAEAPLEEMTAEELKAKAKELGLPTSGSKADLKERIELHLAGPDEEESDDEDGSPAPTADDAPDKEDDDAENSDSDDEEEDSEDEEDK